MKPEYSAALAVAGGHGEAALLRVLCRFFEKTTVERDGVFAVACRLDDLVEIVGASKATISRRMRRLEDADLIVVERGRRNRAPRLFISVPAETYDELGMKIPDRARAVLKRHRFQGETSQVSPCNVHDLNLKRNLKGNLSETASAASDEEVSEDFTKECGNVVKMKDVVIKRADSSKIPLAKLWGRTCRDFGYSSPVDDPKNGRHLKLLDADLRKLGTSVRDSARQLVEKWPEYRSASDPKDPFPWAVRRRLSAYVQLASKPSSGVYTAPTKDAVSQPVAPPPPPPKKKSALAAALLKKGGGG